MMPVVGSPSCASPSGAVISNVAKIWTIAKNMQVSARYKPRLHDKRLSKVVQLDGGSASIAVECWGSFFLFDSSRKQVERALKVAVLEELAGLSFEFGNSWGQGWLLQGHGGGSVGT